MYSINAPRKPDDGFNLVKDHQSDEDSDEEIHKIYDDDQSPFMSSKEQRSKLENFAQVIYNKDQEEACRQQDSVASSKHQTRRNSEDALRPLQSIDVTEGISLAPAGQVQTEASLDDASTDQRRYMEQNLQEMQESNAVKTYSFGKSEHRQSHKRRQSRFLYARKMNS